MTERKPPQTGFTSWIDQQVADAERRGVFDDLPGAGKPLKLRPGAPDGDYGQAWLRDYAGREGVPAEEMLPAPLRLRREIGGMERRGRQDGHRKAGQSHRRRLPAHADSLRVPTLSSTRSVAQRF